MGDMIGQLIPSAVGVAISPLPIVAVVLILMTARGGVNGPAFIVGWVSGLALVGAVLLSIASDLSRSSGQVEQSTWTSVSVLVVGVVLLLVALRQWRRRPRQMDEVKTPKWMEAIDRFSPVKAAGAGVILSALNPKNLLLAVAGAAAIAQTRVPVGQQVVGYVLFIILATIGVGAPVMIYLVLGDRSRALLDRLRNSMVRRNAVIMAVLFLIVGVKLIGSGISGLPPARCPYRSTRTAAEPHQGQAFR
jgi:threonine/homoserine/homoserine lactone efflux protein